MHQNESAVKRVNVTDGTQFATRVTRSVPENSPLLYSTVVNLQCLKNKIRAYGSAHWILCTHKTDDVSVTYFYLRYGAQSENSIKSDSLYRTTVKM